MATITSPTPRTHITPQPLRKDLANLPLHEEGRATPLPQYEKTQTVPFTLTLQEEKNNPGRFQLVVNIDQKSTEIPSDGSPQRAPTKKLYADLNGIPSLGFDVSSLYHTQKSSPPTSPEHEPQGWSDLDAIPPEFLQTVVPDWKIRFSRNDSTASTQSRKLADIKARIKKSGKGFVVRLLKGSIGPTDTDEVAEVHLGQQTAEEAQAPQELDAGSSPRAELDATEAATPPEVFEIGTSSEPGVRGIAPTPTPTPFATRITSIPTWLNHSSPDFGPRNSISEEGFSDAETLTQDIRPFEHQMEDGQTDLGPFSNISSRIPTRSTSVSSIVKTPTRGLTVVGPVRRVEKANRVRGMKGKGNTARLELNRSDEYKSFRRRSPRSSTSGMAFSSAVHHDNISPSQPLRQRPSLNDRSHSERPPDIAPHDHDTWHYPVRDKGRSREKVHRRLSAEELVHPARQKGFLTLKTDVSRPKSANNSPVNRRKRPARAHKPSSSSSSVHFAEDRQHIPSPTWSEEADPSDELREALQRALGTTEDDVDHVQKSPASRSVPRIEEPVHEDDIGNIPMPLGMEIRSAPVNTRNPIWTFWGLAISALAERAFEGLHALRDRYGSEPPVPAGHVRVRWTCSCGDQLYDDFIERRTGAARLLEAYLNRPHSVTPTSPTGRTSTSSTMSSVFSSVSAASTLATPSSTYGGGPSSWGRSGNGDSARFSPSRVRNADPFSIRIGGYLEESWLLTCANEGRFTPKIVHLDVNTHKIRSDKDLALSLREHYEQLNRGWLKWARLRGLRSIEFVQFEVHRNRFADIRATPSMPPTSSSASSKSPSDQPYSFEPVDLVPPVGSTYLLHLFQHPEDYDGELITYLRSPKRKERLEFGLGWGINLVEGFLAKKVWMTIMLAFGVGSVVFAILWTIKKGDVQGAFGVAGWILTLAALVVGGLQAWVE